MSEPTDAYEHLKNLARLMADSLAESLAHVEGLQQKSKSLVLPTDFDSLQDGDTAPHEEEPFNDEAVIEQLSRARLQLVVDIESEDYVFQRLKEMAQDCDELVTAVSDFYRDVHSENQKQQSETLAPMASNTERKAVEKLLQANIENLNTQKSAIYRESEAGLKSLQAGLAKLESPEYDAALQKLVDTLNARINRT